MKVLLDECLPRKLRLFLRGHNCLTAQQVGFAGKKNGALLLAAAEADFDVLLTNRVMHQARGVRRED